MGHVTGPAVERSVEIDGHNKESDFPEWILAIMFVLTHVFNQCLIEYANWLNTRLSEY